MQQNTKKKILIVEDDSVIGADLFLTLEKFGYEVVEPIASGEEVLKRIDTIRPDFILMDISLSGELDGIQTAERLQNLVSIPLVFLSALKDEVTLQRAKLTNPFGYLIKPFDSAELRSTIEVTLNRFNFDKSSQHELGKNIIAEDQHEFEIITSGSSEEQIISAFKKLELFENLNELSLRKLVEVSRIKEIEAGGYVFSEGYKSDCVFLPISGRLSATKSAYSGKDLIVSLLAPGDVFGLLFNFEILSEAISVRSQIDSKIVWIPLRSWEDFLKQNPEIYKNISLELAKRLSAAYILSSSLAHAKVEGRIVNTLIALLPNFGKSSANNKKEQRIFITRKELSELTGTTPETSIRVTKNLERAGALDLSRPGIIKILDTKILQDMCS